MALNCSEQLYGCSWINRDKQFSPLNCRNSIRSMKLKQPRTRGHVIDIHRPNQPTNLNPTEQTDYPRNEKGKKTVQQVRSAC